MLISPTTIPFVPMQSRLSTVAQIRERLAVQSQSLREAIAERALYFRLSLVGACNLSCPFCHNEGASTKGRMDLEFAEHAIRAAARVGFERVQLTGGEPLLHPEVHQFVALAKRIVPDVGITTNGTYLTQKIESLIEAEITRIHISLQVEPLRDAGRDGEWDVPPWLAPMLDYADRGYFILRLNMPVPAEEIGQARTFLRKIARFGCDLKVFSILPEGDVRGFRYPIEVLETIVAEENARRATAGERGEVFLRGYRPPTGTRCASCLDFNNCKEQSHSLRLGADHMLRPCLATRVWDSRLTLDNLDMTMEEAALLAIDYQW